MDGSRGERLTNRFFHGYSMHVDDWGRMNKPMQREICQRLCRLGYFLINRDGRVFSSSAPHEIPILISQDSSEDPQE